VAITHRLAWNAVLRGATLVAAIALAPTQPHAETRFRAAELREDLALLRRSVTEAHAGLYVYETPKAIASAFDSAAAALRDTTGIGFFGTVAGVLARIRDGHTRSLPSAQWMAWYGDSARVFPLRLRIAYGHAWVADSTNARVTRGSEVLSINGHAMGEILRRLGDRLPADGSIETGAEHELSSRFAFWYYTLEGQPSSFRILTQGPDGDTTSFELPAAPSSAVPDPSSQPASLALSFRDDSSVAVIKIGTFSADEIEAARLDYAAFLDSVFASVRTARSRDLVIDLRGNDGGRDVYGSMLLGHLVSRPFAYYRSLEARTRRVTFWRHTNVDSTFNASFGKGLVAMKGGGYRLPRSRHQNLGEQPPRSPRFEGRVWVLTDGGTFSTAAEFCSVARSLGRALFIGEETGGTYEGNSSGTFVILTLPHTGVRVVIPLVRYHLAVKPPTQPGRGVKPDIEIGSAPALDEQAVLEQALGRVRAVYGR
jgi:hypothetical protein